jgi:hypothetical protein
MFQKRTLLILAGLALSAIILVQWSGAQNPSASVAELALTVCPEGPPVCQFKSIQAAIDAAPRGATIQIAKGTYQENLIISRSVRLVGAGQDQTRLLPRITAEEEKDGFVRNISISVLQGPPNRGFSPEPEQVWLEGMTVGELTLPPDRFTPFRTGIFAGFGAAVQVVLVRVTIAGYHSGISTTAQTILDQVTLAFNSAGLRANRHFGAATEEVSWPATIVRFSEIRDNRFSGIESTDGGLSVTDSRLIRNGLDGIELHFAGKHDPQRLTPRQIDFVDLYYQYPVYLARNVIAENGDAGISITLKRGAAPTPNVIKDFVFALQNQVVKNKRYGIVLNDGSCLVRDILQKVAIENQVHVLGQDNEISGNGVADRCPADYAWPPGFLK